MGGRKFSVTPSDKIGIFFNPWTKRVFSLPPSDTKQDFLPLGHIFFLLTPSQFCQILPPSGQLFTPILPPSDSFLSILYPSDSFFHPFYHGQFILTVLPPQTFFDDFTPTYIFFFLRPPLGHKFAKNKNFHYIPLTKII